MPILIDCRYKGATKFQNAINNGYSINVNVDKNSPVVMTDGTIFGKVNPSSEDSGHGMTFKGFDVNGNIQVYSWGKVYTIPKSYYKDLMIMAIKID